MNNPWQDAATLRARGFALCKPDAGTKNPSYKAWGTRSLEPDDIGPADLVGILGGPLSHGGKPGHALVIPDLDDAKSIELADAYLPATGMIEGRQSKPRSHRYYLIPVDTIPEWALSHAEQASKAAIEMCGHPGPFTKSFRHRETDAEVLKLIGTGGQVVAAPSLHPSGERREWEGGTPGEPAVVPFLELWDATCQLASRCGAKMPDAGPPRMTVRATSSPSIEARASRYLATMDPAISEHGGHKATFKAARALVWGFDLPIETAYRMLVEEFNPRCTPPWSERELRHKVEDADRVPCDKPRGWLRNAERNGKHQSNGVHSSSHGTAPKREDKSHQGFADTDIGNGKLFVKDHGENLRYAADMGVWFCFDETRWVVDRSETQVERLAKETVNRMAQEAARKVGELAKAIADAGDDEEEAGKLKVAMKKAQGELAHAKKSSDMRAIRRMLHAARSEPTVCVPVADKVFDRHHHLLNCPNGTVDLKTGRLRAHDREDHITRLCPTEYKPHAKRDVYLAFLDSIFAGKPRAASYVRAFSGYAITGEVSDQTLQIFNGGGSNGKGVLINSWMSTIGEGEYGHTAPAELLVNDGHDRHPTEKTGLRGARLVVCSESPEGGNLDENKMKALTGSDTIAARFMRGDFFEFKPCHKLVLQTNNLPRIHGTDHGVRRRLRLVPFNVRFWKEADKLTEPEGDYPEHLAADPTLEGKILDQREGVLADMVEHAIAFYRGNGTIEPPQEVVAATASYIADQDVIGQFFAARVRPDCGGNVKASDLYKTFKAWWEEQGYPPNKVPGVRKFGMEAGRKFDGTKASAKIYYVRVLSADDREDGSLEAKSGIDARAHARTTALTPKTTPILPSSHSGSHVAGSLYDADGGPAWGGGSCPIED